MVLPLELGGVIGRARARSYVIGQMRKTFVGRPPRAVLPTRRAHAACLRASTSRSYSTGLRYPRLECRRSRLYQVSMYAKIAWRAASRVGQSASRINSVSKVAKKLSATALSQQSPRLLMLATMRSEERRVGKECRSGG